MPRKKQEGKLPRKQSGPKRGKKTIETLRRYPNGRGKYMCGYCQVPKKGHWDVCPYNPKNRHRNPFSNHPETQKALQIANEYNAKTFVLQESRGAATTTSTRSNGGTSFDIESSLEAEDFSPEEGLLVKNSSKAAAISTTGSNESDFGVDMSSLSQSLKPRSPSILSPQDIPGENKCSGCGYLKKDRVCVCKLVSPNPIDYSNCVGGRDFNHCDLDDNNDFLEEMMCLLVNEKGDDDDDDDEGQE